MYGHGPCSLQRKDSNYQAPHPKQLLWLQQKQMGSRLHITGSHSYELSGKKKNKQTKNFKWLRTEPCLLGAKRQQEEELDSSSLESFDGLKSINCTNRWTACLFKKWNKLMGLTQDDSVFLRQQQFPGLGFGEKTQESEDRQMDRHLSSIVLSASSLLSFFRSC